MENQAIYDANHHGIGIVRPPSHGERRKTRKNTDLGESLTEEEEILEATRIGSVENYHITYIFPRQS